MTEAGAVLRTVRQDVPARGSRRLRWALAVASAAALFGGAVLAALPADAVDQPDGSSGQRRTTTPSASPSPSLTPSAPRVESQPAVKQKPAGKDKAKEGNDKSKGNGKDKGKGRGGGNGE